jgi:proteic killer suppression protein
MIRSFRHKGLRALYERDDTKGVSPAQLKRVRALLARLDAAREPADMDFPGLRLHPLKGAMKGFWAVNVSGNWRIVFRFEDQDACDVDLADYH